MPMDDTSNMFRLAVGVFYESQNLASAIGELGMDGDIFAEACLVGTPAAMKAFAQSSESVASRLGGKTRSLPPDLADFELVATDDQLLQTLLDYGRTAGDGASPAHSWLLPDLFGGVAEHLRSGAVVLLVSASDFGRQRRVSRVLLRHTGHTVQTHEFTARRSRSASSSGEDEMPRA
jgi:hypothetical protein